MSACRTASRCATARSQSVSEHSLACRWLETWRLHRGSPLNWRGPVPGNRPHASDRLHHVPLNKAAGTGSDMGWNAQGNRLPRSWGRRDRPACRHGRPGPRRSPLPQIDLFLAARRPLFRPTMDETPPKETPGEGLNKIDLSQLQDFRFGTRWTEIKSGPGSRREPERDRAPRREGGGRGEGRPHGAEGGDARRDRRVFHRPGGEGAGAAGPGEAGGRPGGEQGGAALPPREQRPAEGQWRGRPQERGSFAKARIPGRRGRTAVDGAARPPGFPPLSQPLFQHCNLS